MIYLDSGSDLATGHSPNLNETLGDERSPHRNTAAVHGVTFWRYGRSLIDLFAFSISGDLGHRLSKVFFYAKKFNPGESMQS